MYWWSMLPDYNCTADVENAEQTLEGGWGHEYVHQISNNVLMVSSSHNFTTAVNQVTFSGDAPDSLVTYVLVMLPRSHG